LANAGAFLIICFFGFAAPILAVVSIESLNPIIVFIGLVVGWDTLDVTPKRHYAAFLIGLAPGLSDPEPFNS
jgi:AGZA family xanthine/uracil permease-like MFS transporter